MRKVIKSLGLSLLVLSGVFCLFSCNNEIIPPVIEATPSVKGTISLPASSGLFPEDIWVKVVENEMTKYVGRVNPDATFSVSGLDAAKKYDVMFTSIEPEQQNVSREFKSRAASTTNGFGGWLSDVSASIDDANIGSVKIKPLGTINGKAIRSGAVDNYDVMVYIPGTSFMAMTNEDGSFSIANVPQGTHRLRYTSDDYMSQMKEKVLLFSDDDTVNPVTTVSDVILIKNAGILKGYATLNGAASNAGIIIKLEGDNATGSEIGTTASDGSFSIPDVKPGIYSALFSYAGYIDRKVENLVIEAAKTTSLPSSVSLIANGGTITGSVTQNDGAAGTGASVLAKVTIGEADFTYSSTVDADGKFTLNDCRPADGYSITVSKTGFASVVRSGISLTVEGIILPEVMLSSEFGGLSGYVQDSEMNAINGAQINIGDYTAFTNSEGYFIKSDLPLGQYTVTVSKDGYTTKTLAQKVSIESNKTATIGEQMLTSMYGSINGTIALNDGKSPEGATVTAASADGRNSYPATAASDGTYSISNVLPATYTLSVIKEGYEAGSKTISVTADYTTAAGTITLESLYGSLKVLVNYADKDPDDKITVSIRNGESSIRTATTSNSSTLIFDDIPVGAGYVVVASALGYSSSEKTSVSVISNTETTVQLDDLSNRYGSVSGTVQASSGSPLSGALVLLKGTSEYTATTDGNGAFAKDGIGIGSYEVTISKDGYGTLKLATAVSVESSKVTSIGTQKLTPTTAVISGSAAYADKTDSTGIAITLVDSAEQPVDSFTTTADGQYTFRNVLPGTYKVKAGATGYSAVEKSITVVAGQSYTVALDSLTSLYGKVSGVVTLTDGTAHEGIQIVLNPLEEGYIRSAIADASGNFQITDIIPGTYGVIATRIGYQSKKIASIEIVAGEVSVLTPMELLPSTGSLSGMVMLSGATTYTGTLISAVSAFDTSIKYNATAFEDGSYQITGMSEGEYNLSFQKDGFIADTSQMVSIELGKTTNVPSIILQTSTANVRGEVTLEGAASNEGISILLQDGDSLSYSSSTDQSGSYVINKVKPGTYLLSASKAGYANKTVAEVVVVTGNDTDVQSLYLPVAVRSVTGEVTLELKSDYGGILITATNVSQPSLIYSAITNGSGMYTLAGMVPGEYNVALSKDGYRTLMLPTINIVSDSSLTLESSELKIARGTITGLVKLEGRTNMEDISISLVGTDYTTVTDNQGIYEFLVPSGNYPGGVRFTKTDFENASDTNTITVLTDSTYAVPEKTLRATHSSIGGTVDVLGTNDESGVVVSLSGTSFSMSSDSDGNYRFNHVPLGEYTIRFTYLNTPVVTVPVVVGATEVVAVGSVTLRPNQASIEGFVTLENLTSYAGVDVVARNNDTLEALSTKTGADGSFYIGGLLTTGTFTISFSKAGWDSQNMTVSSLVPLEVRDITTSNPIELADNTPPVLNSVSINDGGNTTSDLTVTLKIDAVEQGSGIRKMRVSWDGTFDTESWIAYAAIAESTITNASNGDKTVSVQIEDLAGNRASATASATITLTDQVKAVSGILEAGELHWTKAESPILVAGDVIVNTGDTLVIDPGVDVQFNGMFAISIRGKLEAIGTAEEPIVFKPAVDSGYTGKWNGITAGSNTLSVNETNYAYTLNEGSIIQHARILDTEKGIRGRILLKDSYIETDGYALGESSNNERFSGYAVGNIIIGSVNFGGTVFNNQMNGDNGRLYGYGAKIINNLFSNYNVLTLYYLSRFDFNTVQNITRFEEVYGFESTPMNNILTGVEQTIVLESNYSGFRDMIFSNIYDNLGNPEIKVNTPWSSLSSHNWRYNYWGDAHTLELQALKASNKNNASFIYDAYDNPDVSIIDWNGFVDEPWEFAGYQGDDFVDFSVNFISKTIWNNNEAKIGEPIEFTLDMLTGSSVAKYRRGQTIEQLKSSSWRTFSGVPTYDAVDMNLLRDGFVDLIVQVQDSDGNISALKTLSVGYEAPKFSDLFIIEGSRYTSDNPIAIKPKFTDNVSLADLRIWLDEALIVNYENSWNSTSVEINQTISTESLKNGDYILTFEVEDAAGNITQETRNIIVDRPVPIASNLSFMVGSTIAEGESLEFSFDLSQATHLKSLKILANGNEMKKMSYVDNGRSDFTFESSIASVYLPNGESTLSVELTDYAGNVALYELGSFTVSGTGADPVIDNVSIADGTVFNTYADTNLTFTTSDSGGVRLIRVLLNGEEIRQISALAYSDTLKVRNIDMAMDIPYRKNGTYVLAIEATDFAGNKTVDERTITIDRALPTATFSMNENDLYDDGTFSVNFSIQDAQTLAYYQLLVDGHQLKYDGYHGLSTERSSTSGSWSWDVENLPAGTHEVTMRVVDIAGNETVTTAQQVVVHRTIVDSDYGVGLTWDTDGTLLQDWSTHYLWDFDNPSARGLDTAGGVLNGDVRQTTVGLGGTATRFYINQDVETQFPDASWTVEYWAKMEHISTYSHFTFGLENVFSTDIIKSSTSNHSYSNSYFIYQTPAGIDLSQASVQGYTSRENRSEWHHYAWVSTGNGLFFYIDGLLVAKLEDKMSNILATRVYIYSDYIDNFMDEIRISMRARSVDELWSYVQYAKDKLPVD